MSEHEHGMNWLPRLMTFTRHKYAEEEAERVAERRQRFMLTNELDAEIEDGGETYIRDEWTLIAPLPEGSYATVVELKREILYAKPDQFGQAIDVFPLDEVEDADGNLDLARVIEQLPDEAWGWFTQERFAATVTHEGREWQLTSLAVSKSGTTFYGARIVDRDEIKAMVTAQRKYVDGQRRRNKPVAALPHGQDKRPILLAMDNGDVVVVTRNGHYRQYDPERDTLLDWVDRPGQETTDG